jgi:hypothetical protein
MLGVLSKMCQSLHQLRPNAMKISQLIGLRPVSKTNVKKKIEYLQRGSKGGVKMGSHS